MTEQERRVIVAARAVDYEGILAGFASFIGDRCVGVEEQREEWAVIDTLYSLREAVRALDPEEATS